MITMGSSHLARIEMDWWIWSTQLFGLMFGNSEEQQMPLKQGNSIFFPPIATVLIQDEKCI